MKKIAWLFLLALALPMTAFATSVEFTNSGGTLTGSSTGLSLSGSTLISDGNISGNNLGSVTFSTAALESGGNLQMGGTFMAGGTFTITGDGMNGVHNGVIFTGAFSGPVTWTLVTLANGTHDYQLSGTLSGTWFTGATVNGATVELTINVGKGFFNGTTTLAGGDTNNRLGDPGTCLSDPFRHRADWLGWAGETQAQALDVSHRLNLLPQCPAFSDRAFVFYGGILIRRIGS